MAMWLLFFGCSLKVRIFTLWDNLNQKGVKIYELGMMTSGLESSLVVCQLIITRLYEKKSPNELKPGIIK